MTVFDGDPEKMQQFVSGKDDFTNDIEVIPVSDPNISSRAEKLIKSQQVLQTVMSCPLSHGESGSPICSIQGILRGYGSDKHGQDTSQATTTPRTT